MGVNPLALALLKTMKYKKVNGVYSPVKTIKKRVAWLVYAGIALLLVAVIWFALIVDKAVRPVEYQHCMVTATDKTLCNSILN